MQNYKEKICLECGKSFIPNSNRQKYCKECGIIIHKKQERECSKKYRNKNKEKRAEYNRKHRQENKEHYREYQKQYRQTEKRKKYTKEYNKTYKENHKEYYQQYMQKYDKNNIKRIEYKQEYQKEYRQKNKKLLNEYRKTYIKNNVNFKMNLWSRQQVYRCLNSKKDKHTFDILGYTPLQLKQRIEFQFKNGMNWDNYGTLWHIDHKKPLSLFNFVLPNGKTDYEQIRLANSLANLQPMYAEENLSKGNKFILNKNA